MVLIILFSVLAVMWVLLAIPRQREARRHNAVVASLTPGDEIMTGGGIYGTVVDVTDEFIMLELAPGMVVKLARRAVATIERSNESTAGSAAGAVYPGGAGNSGNAPDSTAIHSDSTVDARASDHSED